jgi:AraC-like DNA-binding protein
MNKLDRQRPHADRMAADVTPAALPADLVRALDWLRSHLSEPVDLELLASVAGVRPRTLESHFKTFLGTTPLGWLRRTRFANVRRALERGGDDATVTRIALASGFVQLGRFAAEYRAIFASPGRPFPACLQSLLASARKRSRRSKAHNGWRPTMDCRLLSRRGVWANAPRTDSAPCRNRIATRR